jgi:hypothetical protein
MREPDSTTAHSAQKRGGLRLVEVFHAHATRLLTEHRQTITQAAQRVTCREGTRHRQGCETAGSIVQGHPREPAGDDFEVTTDRIHADKDTAIRGGQLLQHGLGTVTTSRPGADVGAEGEPGLILGVLQQSLELGALGRGELTSGHWPHPFPRGRSVHPE